VVAGLENAAQNVPQFWLIVDETQQRLAAGALFAYAENVFGRRIEVEYQEALIDKNDARAKAVENSFWIGVAGIVTAGVPGGASA
jgi:hypothetical protein